MNGSIEYLCWWLRARPRPHYVKPESIAAMLREYRATTALALQLLVQLKSGGAPSKPAAGPGQPTEPKEGQPND